MTGANLWSIQNFCSQENHKTISSTNDSTGGGGLRCATILGSVFQSYYILCWSIFTIHGCLCGSILPIFAYFCCILCVFHQKLKQCFGHKIFVMYSWSLIFLRYPARLCYFSFWKTSLATNCLIDGFSYSNNIFTKFLWEKTA